MLGQMKRKQEQTGMGSLVTVDGKSELEILLKEIRIWVHWLLSMEIRVIAKLVYLNLVRIHGFSWGSVEKLVIYEFVPNSMRKDKQRLWRPWQRQHKTFINITN